MRMFESKPLSGDAIQDAWRQAAPAPDSSRRMIYLHIPFCRSRCAFCGFFSHTTSDDSVAEYTELLLREMTAHEKHPALAGAPIDVVYFGGGTPTDVSAADLRRLIRFIYEHFNVAPDVEFTIEGRLFGFDDEKVAACVDSGATRFSFGVQAFDTALRRSLGRRMSREEVIARLVRIKEICGSRAAVIADLIYGLPGQTQADWMNEARTVHEETPLDGVDLYRLKLLPGIPLMERMKKEPQWSEDELLQRHADACEYLDARGWDRLSITHWGRGGMERNRYNHWTKTGADLAPFGCGAGGSFGDWSFMQTSNLDEYRAHVEAGRKPLGMAMKKPPKHQLRSRIVDQMERGFFDPASLDDVNFAPLVANWTAAGVWAADSDGVCRLTPTGEFYQVRLTALLTGFYFAQSFGGMM